MITKFTFCGVLTLAGVTLVANAPASGVFVKDEARSTPAPQQQVSPLQVNPNAAERIHMHGGEPAADVLTACDWHGHRIFISAHMAEGKNPLTVDDASCSGEARQKYGAVKPR